ncbi:helix-turn-helix transcriptional regulator [Paractinoplanes hotanensis]|uniref:LuxR family transcriptional regulator n=1 Tax=Paractinoplanes hotanensis TaxID=2906497 RepID=A0ABT0XQ73_9ACTN|nr:LuxR family transcriptional regulator [Actinoplanes hotanensis]MCM4075944.1 LuxR family transcriptional regulator [Actinoplanes hotanensis]
MENAPTVHEVPDAVRAVLDAAKAGRGGVLVLHAGIGEGRTTMLRAAAAGLIGWTLLAAPGDADESAVPGAGLQRLLAPLAEHCRHDEPLSALIAGREPRCAPLVLALSLRALLREAARRGPVLCLLDDADQLDPLSWQQIRMLARRVHELPVAILATVTSAPAAAGLPLHRLAPLDEQASHALVRRHAPDTTGEVAAALVTLAGGHPGALTELAGALTPQQQRGLAPLPVSLPPESTLRLRFRTALAAQPEATRDLLLLAAADPGAHPSDLLAAGGPGRGLADLEPAERAGLIVAHADGVRFRPSVLRLIAYDDESIGRRRAAHLALAEVLAARGRRLAALLHRAAVAAAPDDALARDLLLAAEDAPPPEAFAAQRHAAGLSGSPAGEARALLAAARSAMAAGRPHDARPLLRRASRLRGNAAVRARARGLIAEMRLRRAPAEAREALLDVAGELMTTDPAGAVEALLVAGEACGRTGEPGRYPQLARRAAVRCRDGRPVTDMALHQVVGVADLMTGDEETAFRHLREVLRLADHTTDPSALTWAAGTGLLLGQDRRAARLAWRAVSLAREAGNAPLVPEALEVAAFAELATGRHDAATEAALDGAAVARAAGRPDLADAHWDLLGLLAAFRGDAETSRERPAAGDLGDWSEALLDLVAGRPEPAAERLARIARTGSMTLRVAIAPHLVEASGGGGEVFDRWAARTGQPGWLALRSRCRALRGEESADDYFREALAWHERDEDAGFARAHTELLYGRHLRRRRRPAEARDHLRRAAERFRRFDAQPWAEQAARELRAAGERIGPVGRAPLTAQQERIAGLVAEGATNREVAQQLHLSPRTIDHHLRNVFARLGVRSRTELARLLVG